MSEKEKLIIKMQGLLLFSIITKIKTQARAHYE